MTDTTDEAAKDAAMRQRIVTHMNNDHQDSLRRYLEHYYGLSSFTARNAHLRNFEFGSMTITSAGKSHIVPIKPPMKAWSEARPRVVAMDAEAVAGLGRSNITVKKYEKPYGFMLVVFVACVLTFVCFSRRANFEPGSLLYESVLKHMPGFAQFCWRIQPLVILPMILLHGGEAVYMAHSRLAKHSVPVGSKLWLTWVCGTFVEGYGSFKRFDDLVDAEGARRANAKH